MKKNDGGYVFPFGTHTGLTLQEYYSGLMMSAIISNTELFRDIRQHRPKNYLEEYAIDLANDLIRELNKKAETYV